MSAGNTYINQLKVRNLLTIYKELKDHPEALSFLLVLSSIIPFQKLVVHNPDYIEVKIFYDTILKYKDDYYFLEVFKNNRKYILINPSEKLLFFFRGDHLSFFDAWIKNYRKSFNSTCKEHFNSFNYERSKKGLKPLTLEEICSK